MHQKYWIILCLLACLHSLSFSGQQKKWSNFTDSSASVIEKELLRAKKLDYKLSGEPLFSFNLTQQFYLKRQFKAAWINKNRLEANAKSLISALQLADLEGLNPLEYHLGSISAIQSNKRPIKQSWRKLAQLDILLTDAYLTYAMHLHHGKVCPDDINQHWHVPCRELKIDFWEYLTRALDHKTISESLDQLKPTHSGYKTLKAALASYKQLYAQSPDGFSVLDVNGSINMDKVRERLVQLRDLDPNKKLPEDVFEAIAKFKQRHGLPENATIDSATIFQLNTSVASRIATIMANLERWRWLPEKLGSRYITVNIADFSLDVLNQEQVAFSTPVIIGTLYRATPALSAELTKIVLNPYWYLPPSVVREVLAKTDPVSYLQSNNIQVLNSRNQVTPPQLVDWMQHVTPDAFSYILRQSPGPLNALGKIKFVMPNTHAVYLHDTPEKELFEETTRTFSRGCIRVKDPFELAAFLLQDDPKWNASTLKNTADEKSTPTEIVLTSKIPVHVLYWTSWVDGDQTLHFRTDVYKRDEALIEALNISTGYN